MTDDIWAGRASVDAAFTGYHVSAREDAAASAGHPRLARRPRSALQLRQTMLELRPDSPTDPNSVLERQYFEGVDG